MSVYEDDLIRDGKTIKVRKETHKLLSQLVHDKEETYDDIIMRLINHYKESKKK